MATKRPSTTHGQRDHRRCTGRLCPAAVPASRADAAGLPSKASGVSATSITVIPQHPSPRSSRAEVGAAWRTDTPRLSRSARITCHRNSSFRSPSARHVQRISLSTATHPLSASPKRQEAPFFDPCQGDRNAVTILTGRNRSSSRPTTARKAGARHQAAAGSKFDGVGESNGPDGLVLPGDKPVELFTASTSCSAGAADLTRGFGIAVRPAVVSAASLADGGSTQAGALHPRPRTGPRNMTRHITVAASGAGGW
jgi:hypothetical protein